MISRKFWFTIYHAVVIQGNFDSFFITKNNSVFLNILILEQCFKVYKEATEGDDAIWIYFYYKKYNKTTYIKHENGTSYYTYVPQKQLLLVK